MSDQQETWWEERLRNPDMGTRHDFKPAELICARTVPPDGVRT